MNGSKGLVIAAPASGSGKTTITLALLRALTRAGHTVASAKVGPDYIDPKFHEAASGRACVNLDAWAMRPTLLAALAARQAEDAKHLIIEGVMGLFDGAGDGSGSTADVAAALNLSVVLVVDVRAQAQSTAALVAGFASHRADVNIAGVILNRVGSARHAEMIKAAMEPLGLPVLGAVMRSSDLELPSRYLGLVQAGEHDDLEAFLEHAADSVGKQVSIPDLLDLAAPIATTSPPSPLPPLGQRIAVASDAAFAFFYPHLAQAWQDAEVSFFSPLADEAPDLSADAVFLPGGYPELHAGRLAGASRFAAGMHQAAERGALIYGECGGYMTLGEGLTDKDSVRHAMLGLLPVETSFEHPRLHLGYRRLIPQSGAPWQQILRGHEFHYAQTLRQGAAPPLFSASDALGSRTEEMGCRVDRVMGSFAHIIDVEDQRGSVT